MPTPTYARPHIYPDSPFRSPQSGGRVQPWGLRALTENILSEISRSPFFDPPCLTARLHPDTRFDISKRYPPKAGPVGPAQADRPAQYLCAQGEQTARAPRPPEASGGALRLRSGAPGCGLGEARGWRGSTPCLRATHGLAVVPATTAASWCPCLGKENRAPGLALHGGGSPDWELQGANRRNLALIFPSVAPKAFDSNCQ